MTLKHTGLVMDKPQPALFSPSPQPQAVLTYNYQYAAQFDATLMGKAEIKTVVKYYSYNYYSSNT
jgi:hypothetical protein